ncbi:MAG TPA: glutathione S-transferase family protein [Burkholderiales bacterium]|nr:glutathione S-transferase family protein [Burkholderiales bacterium]
MKPVTIIGGYVSPYVRKVLVALQLKGVPYEIDPIIPFFGDDRFSRLSPLRRIPVLIDGDLALADSSVICEYLEDRHPTPALYPRDPAARAKARWLEEYADSRMGDVIIWQLFNEVTINPFVFGVPTNQPLLDKTLSTDLPEILDYLETQAPASGYRFGSEPSIADVSVAVFFRNAAFARWKPDPERWPKAAAWIERTLALPSFAALRPFEDKLIRTPPAQHRAALAELGAPLSLETCGSTTLRRSLMRG